MPAWLPMVVASLLFATMGVCVKMASAYYGSGEIVLYRGVVGAVLVLAIGRWRGESLRTAVPGRHALRSATGVAALALWFHAIGGLPLATAMTLNYTSSLWLAVYLALSAALVGTQPVDRRLVLSALLGFAGVMLVLRPTMAQHQLWFGVAGLLSGMVSAAGYLQVRSLARAGEPESRIVFYFSIGGVLGGAALASVTGWHAHHWTGIGWMLAVGVLSTAGQIMLTHAYARGSTLVNASLQYLAIVFAFAYGAMLFGDTVTSAAAIGVLLVVVAGSGATLMRASANHADAKSKKDLTPAGRTVTRRGAV
jgi:S-adenosylmethionine uptake transporter